MFFLSKIRQLKFPFSFSKNDRGNILLAVIVFGSVSLVVIITALSGYAISENRASVRKHEREMSFQIAEAGINYYRWHLAHDNDDYYDGHSSSTPGPYVREYEDKDGNVVGYFSLEITPDPMGSSVVTIESTGWLTDKEQSARTIKARVGFPALTDYSFITNSDVWIGDDEETHGKFHANGGVRFDGLADATVSSAMEEYNCQAHHGCGGQLKPGVWGTGGPQEYWEFPVPAKDFEAVTAELSDIKEGADEGGVYLTSSGVEGWRLRFTSDGQVLARKVGSCKSYKGVDVGDNKYVWYCIDINNYSGSDIVYDMPENGFIYVEDRVWVDGTVNGKATVGVKAGESIIINDDIIYLAKDGNHALGLIAPQDILVPHDSPDDLEIDAALLAQFGACKRYYYPGNTKDTIYIHGSVITAGIWTWSWVSGGGEVVSGYENTISSYDPNLSYGPPPGFPIGRQYYLISWEEVK